MTFHCYFFSFVKVKPSSKLATVYYYIFHVQCTYIFIYIYVYNVYLFAVKCVE